MEITTLIFGLLAISFFSLWLNAERKIVNVHKYYLSNIKKLAKTQGLDI